MQKHNTVSLTAQLASAMLSLRDRALPDEVEKKATVLLKDLVACALSGSQQDEVKPVYTIFREWGGKAESTVWCYGERLPMHAAAIINGTFAHALEMDDTHRSTYCHTGAGVIPAALAVAEATHASGADLLKAIVAGYDVSLRVASSITPQHRLIGFHPTSTMDGLGAAMAAAMLLGFDEEQTVNALGLAGTQAGGFYQFQYDGASSKRFHPGRAAQSGIIAAMLAREGFTGSPEILEGRYGLCKVMSPEFRPAAITDTLGTEWKIMEVGIKPYSACRFCHAPIDAAKQLRAHPLWNYDKLESLELVCSGQLKDQTGGNSPETPLEAQLSTPNAMALALLVGRNMPEDVEAHFKDPRVMELTRRIVLTVNKDIPYPSREVTLKARIVGCAPLSFHVMLPCGEPETPLPDDVFKDKIFAMCTRALTKEGTEKLIHAVDSIASCDDVSRFCKCLVRE